MIEDGGRGGRDERETIRVEILHGDPMPPLRLGEEIRFLFVCVGGGAARIGAEVLREPPRHTESVAVNCDPRVQHLEAFDRRVYLGPPSGPSPDVYGSPLISGQLAHAAEPALARLFEGATFVTLVASLGGGTGTGVLPYVLDAAARASAVLSVFLVKPFACEGDRRALAERAMGRLHFLDAFVEKQQLGQATLTVLDNESLVPAASQLPMRRLNRLWAGRISTHMEESFLRPAEAALEAGRLAQMAESGPARTPLVAPDPGSGPLPLPALPTAALPLLSADFPHPGEFAPGFAELTFEVGPDQPPRGELR